VELVPLDVLFAELELLDELVEFDEVVALVALLVFADASSII
jgi:hypothetical protein